MPGPLARALGYPMSAARVAEEREHAVTHLVLVEDMLLECAEDMEREHNINCLHHRLMDIAEIFREILA